MIIDIIITREDGTKFKHTIAYKGVIDRIKVQPACEKAIGDLLDKAQIK